MENKYELQIQKIENDMKVIKIGIQEAQLLFENLLNLVNCTGNNNEISEIISEFRSKTMSLWMSNYFLQQEIKKSEDELLINQQNSEIVQKFRQILIQSEMIKILIDHLRNLLEQNRYKFLKFLVAKK
jgi:hypothetical protein